MLRDGVTPLYVGEEQVRKVLSIDTLIPALTQALIDFSAGRIQQPVRSVLRLLERNGWFAVMPAVYGDVMGAKLVTVYPDNTLRNIPTHLATIQLFSATTGEPLAVMDGRLITEMRTAAVSAIATNLLAPHNARVLAILGSGVQAKSHLAAVRKMRAFDEIRVWSRTEEHGRIFATEHGIAWSATVEAAVNDADVVVTVTGSGEPILQGRWLKREAYVNAVGALGLDRRELDEEAMEATVVVESREAAIKESGDIVLAGAQIFAELGELLADPSLLKTDKPEGNRVVFKSLGIAAEDITAANLVYQALRALSVSFS